jgi:predicted TIM-barrel fold metal-dependent hydrolase
MLWSARNAYSDGVAGRRGVCAIASGVPAPPAVAGAAAEAERCFALGAVGLGELNADAQRFDLTEPGAVAPVAEVCRSADRPLLLHATEPVGHRYPGKGTATPDRLVRFLEAHPELRVVLAHWGGGLPFYELMPEVAVAAARVVYDTAASTYLYRPQVFRAVLDVVGAERVLWGSDYPVLRQDRFLRRTLAAGLQPEELDPMLGANARRVYGLPDPAGETSG